MGKKRDRSFHVDLSQRCFESIALEAYLLDALLRAVRAPAERFAEDLFDAADFLAAGLLAETDLDLLAEERAFDPAFLAADFLAPAERFAVLDFAAALFAGRAFFAAAFLLGAAFLPFSKEERRRSRLSKRCSTPPALLFPAFTMILPFFIGNINHYINNDKCSAGKKATIFR